MEQLLELGAGTLLPQLGWICGGDGLRNTATCREQLSPGHLTGSVEWTR